MTSNKRPTAIWTLYDDGSREYAKIENKMADTKLLALVREWCAAKAQYDDENFPGGFPFYTTAHRLYHAGRALYLVSGVEPAEGVYKFNKWFEHPTERTQKILDTNQKRVRKYATASPDAPSPQK